MHSVAIVMPCYNEQEGILLFIKELNKAFLGTEFRIYVVDDSSKDETANILKRALSENLISCAVINEYNQGHGPSVIRALEVGLKSNSEFVLSVDSDGQFFPNDLRNIFDEMCKENIEIIEGVRTNRNDPSYRKVTSFVTRFLVFSKCGKWPLDANSPLRIYNADVLRALLKDLQKDFHVPNLYFSIKARRNHLEILEFRVVSRNRYGESEIGTTWGKGAKFLPNRRFLKFCTKSFLQIFSI